MKTFNAVLCWALSAVVAIHDYAAPAALLIATIMFDEAISAIKERK